MRERGLRFAAVCVGRRRQFTVFARRGRHVAVYVGCLRHFAVDVGCLRHFAVFTRRSRRFAAAYIGRGGELTVLPRSLSRKAAVLSAALHLSALCGELSLTSFSALELSAAFAARRLPLRAAKAAAHLTAEIHAAGRSGAGGRGRCRGVSAFQRVSCAGRKVGACKQDIACVPYRRCGVEDFTVPVCDLQGAARGDEICLRGGHTAKAAGRASEYDVGDARGIALRHAEVSDRQDGRAHQTCAGLGVERVAVAGGGRVDFQSAAAEVDAAVRVDAVAVCDVDVNAPAVLVIGEGIAGQVRICGVDAVVGGVDRNIAGIDVQRRRLEPFLGFFDGDRRTDRSLCADVHHIVALDAVVRRRNRDIAGEDIQFLVGFDAVVDARVHVQRQVFDRQRGGREQDARRVAVFVFLVEIVSALDAVFAVCRDVQRAAAAEGDVCAVLALDDRVFDIRIERFVGIDVVVVVLVVAKSVDRPRRRDDHNFAALVAGDRRGRRRRERQTVKDQRDAGHVLFDHDAAARTAAGHDVGAAVLDREGSALDLKAAVDAAGHLDARVGKHEFRRGGEVVFFALRRRRRGGEQRPRECARRQQQNAEDDG